MAGDLTACPSCKKQNKSDGRYCIHCGSILKPVYCSKCGTPNPDNLAQCLECGNSLPDLKEIRWNPIVTVIQPTAAMVDDILPTHPLETEPEESAHTTRGLLSRLRDRLTWKEKQTNSDD